MSDEIKHTTAVEPILKAGEGLEKHLTKARYCALNLDDVMQIEQALAEWRRVKGSDE